MTQRHKLIAKIMNGEQDDNTILEWDTEDEIWVARVPDLPGCLAFGDTQSEALKELQVAIPAWIEAAKDSGYPFRAPAPDIDTLSRTSKLLNMAEVARSIGIAPRTLHSRIQHKTPLKKEEAERLREALAANSVMLV